MFDDRQTGHFIGTMSEFEKTSCLSYKDIVNKLPCKNTSKELLRNGPKTIKELKDNRLQYEHEVAFSAKQS